MDFGDIKLNIRKRTCQPNRKSNDKTLSIHISSNHATTIIKQTSQSIDCSLSDNSSKDTKKKKKTLKNDYETVIKASGFLAKLIYIRHSTKSQRKHMI